MHKGADLAYFRVVVGETDLDIGVSREVLAPELVAQAAGITERLRAGIEDYIAGDPVFGSTLEPYRVPPSAPDVVRSMAEAAELCGVGPMAAVAGAVAEGVGRELAGAVADRVERELAGRAQRLGAALAPPDIVVENGGDIFILSARDRLVGIFAGASPFTGRLALLVGADQARAGVGVCTSSGTVGHSLSFGKADAAVVVASSTPLADAAATALGNRVREAGDLEPAVTWACSLPGVHGAVAILGGHMAAKGRIALKPVQPLRGQPGRRASTSRRPKRRASNV